MVALGKAWPKKAGVSLGHEFKVILCPPTFYVEFLVFFPAAQVSLDNTLPTDEPEISADRFADHFRISLSPEIRDWIQQGLWRMRGPGEFSRAINPARLVEAPEDFIWPALMPPDFLPLVGNRAGDWLCARVDDQSRVAQIVHWYHGGGDWIPWGKGLAETILFDFVSLMLPGPHRRHAIDAEPRRPEDVGTMRQHPWLRWAMERIGDPVGDLVRRAVEGESNGATDKVTAADLAIQLLDQGVAATAVHCELIQAAGTNWSSIESRCRSVLQQTEELAWPWDWLGLAGHSLGRVDEARSAWIQAATCSAFTDQSVRMQPHSTAGIDPVCDAKFSILMLRRLGADAISSTEHAEADYINGLICLPDKDAKRFAYDYWRSRAAALREGGDPAGAVAMLTRAGWDLGTEPMSVYGGLLTQIASDARLAGQHGRARLAEIHASVWAG